MSSPSLSTQTRRDLDKFIKTLCLKSMQIIVQGRLGKSICTDSIPFPAVIAWFNLAIKEYPEIQREGIAAISEGLPNVDKSFVIEISLRTSDADSLVLEVWSISLTDKCENVSVRHTIYNRMSLLLKSLLCLSRITPAYKLSRQQGNEYVVCYRVYSGQVSLTGLGEGFKTLRVGSISTPSGTITMSAAYRTTENLHVSTRESLPQANAAFDIVPDHFANRPKPYLTSPARPCYTLQSRLRTLSETSDGMQPPIVGDSPSYNDFNVPFSISPVTNFMEREKDSVMFTVGTPPSGYSVAQRSVSSPILARTQRISYASQQNANINCSPSCRFNSHSANCTERQTIGSFRGQRLHQNPAIVSGTSAPTVHWLERQSSFETNERRTSVPCVTYRTNPTSHRGSLPKDRSQVKQSVSGTTFWHWDNSTVIDGVMQNTDRTATVKFPSKNVVANACRRYSSVSPASSPNNLTNTPPSVTGAFVIGSKPRTQDTLEAADLASLPFGDLLQPDQDDESVEDDSSLRSSEEDSPERIEKLGDTIRSERSNNSMLSKKSVASSNTDNAIKQPDDFVMIDLKPAFARDESIGDLGTFYKECENVPDLLMFEDQHGVETDETLYDLTKQLDDYQRDAADFDQFISELSI